MWLTAAAKLAACLTAFPSLFSPWQLQDRVEIGVGGNSPHFRSKVESGTRWPDTIKFAVDYYPSQWPESMWESDAARMKGANVTHVRISEFDWALLEPRSGHFDWSLLDKSIRILSSHDLKVILGTPTVAPPQWACRDYDILAVDARLHTRRFGSRRHYSFSSPDFRMLSKRIVEQMARRYGSNPTVVAWQLDNEFGNSASARSYDKHAEQSFRRWLKQKYVTIDNLNEKQGRLFWSSLFRTFDEIEIPHLETEESSPALRLDYYHFSSDELIDYARMQSETIRKYSKIAITTNFMAFEFSFDHYDFARKTKIDFATWDSYPLGNTEMLPWVSDEDKLLYARTGRPDFQALQHAFFRGVAGAAHGDASGKWGVMEQQPGPVNWAFYNPSPAPGQVRLWLHDMISQGSSLNNIFRWRQVPYGQEQMHAGMLRIDDRFDVAYYEQQETIKDIEILMQSGASLQRRTPKVAIVIDYPSAWYLQANPQGGRYESPAFEDIPFNYAELISTWHTALRRLSVDVDLIAPSIDLRNYSLVLVPTMVHLDAAFDRDLANFSGDVILGARTASKVETLSQPSGLPPDLVFSGQRLPVTVTRVESLRKGLADKVRYHGKEYPVATWSEWLVCERDGEKCSEDTQTIYASYRDGEPAQCEHVDGLNRRSIYLGWYATEDFLIDLFAEHARRRGIPTILGQDVSAGNRLDKHVRLAARGDALFAFNYNDREEGKLQHLPEGAELIVGGVDGDPLRITKSGVNIYKLRM